MSGYPVIMNGDHAEFEQEWAGRDPRERPDWPLPSFDARDWAEAFCKIAKTQGHDLDESWMVSWFASALMRGYDEHAKRQGSPQAMRDQHSEFDDCVYHGSYCESASARAEMKRLATEHGLRFTANPGGGEFNAPSFRCQIGVCDDVEDLNTLREAIQRWSAA